MTAAAPTERWRAGRVPAGYKQVLDRSVTREMKVCQAQDRRKVTAMLVVSGIGGFAVGFLITGKPLPPVHLLATGLLVLLLGNGVLIAASVAVHELVHGLAMRSFAARPTYGAMWRSLMFYATAPGYAFRRDAYLLVALAPLGLSVVYGIGAFVMPAPLSLAFFVTLQFNTLGAIGDLMIARKALAYPRNAYVIDEKDGMRVFMPASQAAAA